MTIHARSTRTRTGTRTGAHAGPTPARTRVMNIAHAAMRRELVRARLVLGSPAALSPDRRRALGEELGWFVEYILHHHHGEDRELFPRLLALDPGVQDLMATMEQDHQAIHPALDALRSVAGRFGAGEASAEELLAAVDGLEQALLPHLEREEREAMPHVVRLMSHEEWHELTQRAWARGVPKPVLARMGLWILDGQPAEDAALMESTLSRAEVALLKLIFGPGHRRRSRRLWGGTPATGVPALSAEARRDWSGF